MIRPSVSKPLSLYANLVPGANASGTCERSTTPSASVALGYTFAYTSNDLAVGGHIPFAVIAGSPTLAFLAGALRR